MKDADLLWLSGLLEGEGNFAVRHPKNRPHSRLVLIQIAMTDRDVLERAANLMKAPGIYTRAATSTRKESYSAIVTGHKAAELMKLLLPHMGKRRSEQIRTSLQEWAERPIALRERGKMADCHPERPHGGNGLCEQCYRHQRYLNLDIPRRAAMRAAKTRDILFV